MSQPSLAAQRLQADPRLAEAKKLILEAVAEHQQDLNQVRPPAAELTGAYQATLEQFGTIRGSQTYFPFLGSGLGNGPFVELADGSVKLDMITGIGVHGFGHSHPALIEAGIDAAVSDTVMQGNLQQNTSSYDIVKLLVDTACESGGSLNHCFLTTSGAMANENALKMAFQKNHPADRIVSFSHCFAGRTLGLAAVTDKAKYRVGLPSTLSVDYIPFFRYDEPERSTEIAVNHLKYHFDRYPGKHAALWLELVQGEGGYYEGDATFFNALIDVAREHGVAVIADEVQSFCRTTRPFAFQHFGLDEKIDIVTVGKISQVCATLFTDDYNPQPGLISQTFTGSTWAIYAAYRIVSGLIANGNFGADGKNVRLHTHFVQRLKEIGERHPGSVTGPYGVGGMVAFTAFDGSAALAGKIIHRMYEQGLMAFLAGGESSRIRFLMPLGCVEPEHIDLACDILENTLGEFAAEA